MYCCIFLQTAYRQWLCSQYVTYYLEDEPIKPCLTFCDQVAQYCPFFRPFGESQIGEPGFLCKGEYMLNHTDNIIWAGTQYFLQNISEDNQEFPQSRSTALPRHQKKERRRTDNTVTKQALHLKPPMHEQRTAIEDLPWKGQQENYWTVCVSIEDSVTSTHPRSLIRVFARPQSVFKRTAKTDRPVQMRRTANFSLQWAHKQSCSKHYARLICVALITHTTHVRKEK